MDWRGEAEPGLAVMLISASVVGSDMVIAATPVATVGLHCLARRFQRASANRTDEATVLDEIGQLALRFPTIAPDGGEFAYQVPGGRWCGHVVESCDNHVVVVARTFLDADAPAMAA